LQKAVAKSARWTEKEQTQADIEVLILNSLFTALPTPPFTEAEKTAAAGRVYRHVWSLSENGQFAAVCAA